jgi:hypothetical protein
MKKHVFDFKPYSRGREARLLLIWEAAYRYRRLLVVQRTTERIYEIKAELEMSESEVVIFLGIIHDKSFKQIRTYLLINGSKLVRRGKKTRPRKKI